MIGSAWIRLAADARHLGITGGDECQSDIEKRQDCVVGRDESQETGAARLGRQQESDDGFRAGGDEGEDLRCKHRRE